MNKNLKFSVLVITYNQEKYIAQALDSILNQRHSYTYEIVIGEDCSIDNTRLIIEDYAKAFPDIIKPIYNTCNLGIINNYFSTLRHCSGEYIMECAGDDYWLAGKVEKQIKFMDIHSEVGMCYGQAMIYNESKKKIENKTHAYCKKTLTPEALLVANGIVANTVCMRNEFVKKYLDEVQPQNKHWVMEDYPMWIWFAINSKIYYLKKLLTCYRVFKESACHFSNDRDFLAFHKSVYEVKVFYSHILNRTLNPFDGHAVLAYRYSVNGDRGKAYKEFRMIANKSFKDKIMLLLHSNICFYFVLKIYRYMKM